LLSLPLPHLPILVANPITLGQLSGNRFEIVLREVQSDPTTVQAACEGLKATGYVNYFGLQRFGRGGSESGSHLIGLQIFQSNWKGALDLMFKPLPADRQDVLQAKTAYQRGDYAVAKDLLPPSMYSEIQVLERLISDPRDHHGAFHSIPRSTQLICVHALQSFIFNLASTHR
jgi:tRNA pseudouridine13 synthase